MTLLSKQDLSVASTVASVLVFNAIMLILLELPLLGYLLRPDATAAAVDRFSRWLSRRGAQILIAGGTFIGCALLLRGALSL
jgi:hypothetical protein